MKTLALIIFSALFATAAYSQAFCLATSDNCCDGYWSSNSTTTTIQENDLILSYQATSEDNELNIVLQIDGSVAETWTVCGCGSVALESDLIGPGHEVALKVECVGCGLSQCQNGDAKVTVYRNVASPACKLSCD